MLRCPRCNKKDVVQPTGKEWNYNVFDVKSFMCNNCKKKFNAYFRENELKYTIPKTLK